ncbi:7-cyano-7-deazaguanine synthase [Fangia hongkongensis]|uniref:7-cyano-7-deazaguanine synthase n=3 Tax=Fangia hongkongensis TaxID=270495 RepID=UPI00037A6C8A|nr:7-cyano-7-deazaguanine synthase [Fangia hongkongensis]
MTTKKYAVLSLSGGMDSSSLLLHLLAHNYSVFALSFDYGQKHKTELMCAQKQVKLLQDKGFDIHYKVITLEGLSSLLSSTLIENNAEVPEGHYQEETMRQTVVPNRNKIFSSIIQSVALSLAVAKDTQVEIAMGVHAGDHQVYPDCTESFRDKDYAAFLEGNWDSEKVSYYLPYINVDKSQVLEDGLLACQSLDLDYKVIYRNTFTSYKPIMHAGEIYSDYKSSSSIERIEAFMLQDIEDPINYADENGPVDWQRVCEHASVVIDEFKRKSSAC